MRGELFSFCASEICVSKKKEKKKSCLPAHLSSLFSLYLLHAFIKFKRGPKYKMQIRKHRNKEKKGTDFC